MHIQGTSESKIDFLFFSVPLDPRTEIGAICHDFVTFYGVGTGKCAILRCLGGKRDHLCGDQAIDSGASWDDLISVPGRSRGRSPEKRFYRSPPEPGPRSPKMIVPRNRRGGLLSQAVPVSPLRKTSF